MGVRSRLLPSQFNCLEIYSSPTCTSLVNCSNLFDPVLSPFRFSRENTLGFVKRALESAVPKQLFMALSWLQVSYYKFDSQFNIRTPLPFSSNSVHTVKSHFNALGLYNFMRGFGRAYKWG